MHPIRFLALGDSYTIGESVPAEESWPLQLASRLRDSGLPLEDPKIVARTGWTTAELREGITQAGVQGMYQLVSLQIGVNNQYRSGSRDGYQREFHELLASATRFAGEVPGRVIVLSIPDWGGTPFARGRDRKRIAEEIDAFNLINREEAVKAGAAYIDITSLSRLASVKPSLIAEDGLHPSSEMYRTWVNKLLPAVFEILDEKTNRNNSGNPDE